MEELDLLKKNWNKADAFEQISETEIYKMLHKKSSSIVRWILIISILELFILRGIDLFFIFFDAEDISILKDSGLYNFELFLNAINVLVLIVFIYLLYKNYIKIANDSATKQLMEDIIRTRKIVQYYVNYNLIMIVFTFIYSFYRIIFYSQGLSFFRDSMLINQNKMVFVIVVLFVILILIFVFFWLFYKLLYGILLKKLNRNFIELKKIDL